MNKESLIYIACPYSHPNPEIKNKRREIATQVAGELFAQGKLVYSPLTHVVPLFESQGKTASWATAMRLDKALISRCQEMLVITIPGWEESVGVTEEIEYAQELGLKVSYFEPSAEILALLEEPTCCK